MRQFIGLTRSQDEGDASLEPVRDHTSLGTLHNVIYWSCCSESPVRHS